MSDIFTQVAPTNTHISIWTITEAKTIDMVTYFLRVFTTACFHTITSPCPRFTLCNNNHGMQRITILNTEHRIMFAMCKNKIQIPDINICTHSCYIWYFSIYIGLFQLAVLQRKERFPKAYVHHMGVWFVSKCSTDGGMGNLWSPSLSMHRLSCTGCWKDLLLSND